MQVGQSNDRFLRNAGRFIFVALCAIAFARCGSTSTVTTAPTPLKCGLSLSMAPSNIGAEGGTGSVTVATQAECAWTATTTASWISGLSPASGQGGGKVDFQVAANPGSQSRQATIQLNDGTVQIRQDGAACKFELTPKSQALSASGGNISIAVSTLAGCAWTARSVDAAWLTVSAPAAGNGNGTVTVVGELAGRRLASSGSLTDVREPHPTLPSVDTIRLTSVDQPTQRLIAVLGVKWNVAATFLVSASVMRPLTSAGLHTGWVPTLTVEYSVGR